MPIEMSAYKCTNCGQLHHPAHFVCVKCGGREFEPIPLDEEATLVTYTRVYNLPEGYMKPFISFGIARFNNGLCIAGQLETEHPAAGMKLRATVGTVKEGIGQDYLGLIFHAID